MSELKQIFSGKLVNPQQDQTIKALERQLEEARELIDDCLSEIKANYDYDFEEYTMLKERLMQLKEKG